MRSQAAVSRIIVLAAAVPALDLDAILADARCGGADGTVAYRAPGPVRHRLERVFFAVTLAAARTGSPRLVELLSVPAALLGYRIILGNEGTGPVAVVIERPSVRRGAGSYVLRLGAGARELFLQAPHTFSDVGSSDLALDLFRRLDARLLGVGTVHRRGRAGISLEGGDPLPAGEADVAHDPASSFQAATLAWLSRDQPGLVVQIHGFADGRAPADAVLSAATLPVTPRWLKQVGTAAAAALPNTRIAVYPDETRVLGGRANVQGQAVRRARARFLHIELSASLRRSLLADAGSRDALAAAIAQGL